MMSHPSIEESLKHLTAAIDAATSALRGFTQLVASTDTTEPEPAPEKKKAPAKKTAKKATEAAEKSLDDVRLRLHEVQKAVGIQETKDALIEEFGRRQFTTMEPDELSKVYAFLDVLETQLKESD